MRGSCQCVQRVPGSSPDWGDERDGSNTVKHTASIWPGSNHIRQTDRQTNSRCDSQHRSQCGQVYGGGWRMWSPDDPGSQQGRRTSSHSWSGSHRSEWGWEPRVCRIERDTIREANRPWSILCYSIVSPAKWIKCQSEINKCNRLQLRIKKTHTHKETHGWWPLTVW